MRKATIPILIYLVLCIMCSAIIVSSTQPEKYEMEVGSISEHTITATRDIEDTYTMDLQISEKKQKVPPVYTNNDAIIKETVNFITADFNGVQSVNEKIQQDTGGVYNLTYPAKQELLKLLPKYLDESHIPTIAALTPKKIGDLKSAVVSLAEKEYEEGITIDGLEDATKAIENGIKNESEDIQKLCAAVVENNLNPNLTYDSAATEKAMQQVADEVKPIVYKKGQNIVQKGEVITDGQMFILRELGLLKSQNVWWNRFAGTTILIALLFVVWLVYLYQNDRRLMYSFKKTIRIACTVLLLMLLTAISRKVDLRINPIILCSIVASVVIRNQSAIALNVMLSILGGMMLAPAAEFIFAGYPLVMIVASMLGGTLAIIFIKGKQHRYSFVVAGLIAGATNALIFLSYGILSSYSVMEIVTMSSIAVASGLLCGMASVGILPILEIMFSITTPTKLLELSNPTQPLLKRLMIEAPGTYHHSIMAANLAEVAAEAVGADEMLVRVACYYHDIGKLMTPIMYKENQMQIDNPLDKLTPEESSKVIRSHVKDGLILAEKHGLPGKICDIIRQHHGDDVTPYFFRKAQDLGLNPDATDYKYNGPKPQTKESGIVMLADIVEATVRASGQRSEKSVSEIIAKLIKDKYDSGQLDECPLNRRDLTTISKAFEEVFIGINHERIEYPNSIKET